MNRVAEQLGIWRSVGLMLLAAASFAGSAPGDDAVANEEPTGQTTAAPQVSAQSLASGPASMPAELQRIQRRLGGPIVDRFSTLEETEGLADETPSHSEQLPAVGSARSGDPLPTTAPGASGWNPPSTVAPMPPDAAIFAGSSTLPAAPGSQRAPAAALRDAAAELDDAANRLEKLELYRQADALRSQAQRLRLDARVLLGRHEYRAPSPDQPISSVPTPGEGDAPPWEAPVIMEQRPDAPPKPRRFGMRVAPTPMEAEATAPRAQ